MATDFSPRVLILVHRFFDNSPYSFYVHEQALALAALGADVSVVAPVAVLPGQRWLRPAAWRIAKGTPEEAVVDGIPVFYPRFPALGNPGEHLLGGLHEALGAWPVVRRLHEEKPFDLIHAHLLTMDGHAGLCLGEWLERPVVLTAHGTDVLRYFAGRPSRRNRRILTAADRVMAVSEKLAKILSPYRPAGVGVVHNGVDTRLVPEGTGAGSGRLLSAGTLKARKAMDITLEAFLQIAGAFPQATLTLVGEGPDRAKLTRRIEQTGMQHRVRLTGNLPHGELLSLMASSDGFVMPSWDEGFGVVYLEAMAAGCVAVGSRGEGIADLIEDGENGLLVPVRDIDAVAQAMEQILKGGPALAQMRARGIEDAKKKTWTANAKEVLAIYRGVLCPEEGEDLYAP